MGESGKGIKTYYSKFCRVREKEKCMKKKIEKERDLSLWGLNREKETRRPKNRGTGRIASNEVIACGQK